ncbi:XRE family transcriptional regulator [Flavobacterium sp. WLB]|uniref:helix-turn-helix domain-containing protein n=1 Tax=Flavobacterium TaxID=237 RepID=UPI0006ABDF01|nr:MULTISPECIES: helix-turn-helix transcriptional regulator [Flavobacterium]KOP36997.1 DNA-binding protein [Flavobacterium sp. VMW]OWU89719.1 DNA-binding protein [Flavobacterium sp. NLM]PUU68254.1 XRE family transcriptional regulator [Flavobacterium sp. WLB]UUF13309.1 helix-turn-helix domain-containing protein [Flavobacterium panici]
MVNIDDFVKRLEIILDYYGLNASSFADKIGVQRSSMSHLLSGRNKPSLDFVMKILDVFPEVDLYWILVGKGNFPKSENETVPNFQNINSDSPSSSNENYSGEDLFTPLNKEENKSPIKSLIETKKSNLSFEEDEIEKIVIFYKNGTFKAYVP